MYNSYQIPGSFNSSMDSSLGRPMYSSMNRPISSTSDSRLIGGGFAGPFLLGGITGGLISPLFYNRPRPYYNNYYYYPPYAPRPYPPYRPY